MRSRLFIIVSAVLVLVLALGGGMYAYDRSGRDTIPKGVRVAGIDVGGLNAQQAKAKLEREYLAKLRTPVRVDHGTVSFTLGPKESRIAANLDAMVNDALEQARTGNIFSRTFRRITGGSLHVDLAPEATFSEAAAVRLVDHIRGAVDRGPIDAKVTFASGGMRVQEGRDGLAVLSHDLHRQIDRALVDPNADHTIVAHTKHTPPKVTSAEIASQYRTALIVDRSHFTLRLFKNLKQIKTYPVAIGAVGLETPAGLYHIQNKAVDPAWTMPNSSWVAPADRGKVVPPGPQDPLKARWLGIFDGAGIHGIDPSEYGSIGHAASHGCVRMTIPDVIDLYDRVPVGAPIYIA
jgi:lipoprotein-anchoring transpeptidase ErfK/SrfK